MFHLKILFNVRECKNCNVYIAVVGLFEILEEILHEWNFVMKFLAILGKYLQNANWADTHVSMWERARTKETLYNLKVRASTGYVHTKLAYRIPAWNAHEERFSAVPTSMVKASSPSVSTTFTFGLSDVRLSNVFVHIRSISKCLREAELPVRRS